MEPDQLFTLLDQFMIELPSWGYADTYAYIGKCLREKGDLLGARNAYERALIVAPDFAAARRELQELLRN